MQDSLWTALALLLIVEGLLPVVAPRVWRAGFRRLTELTDGPLRVVGVLPKDFEMPLLEKADVLMPEGLGRVPDKAGSPAHVFYAFGRLRPGVTIPQATEQ